MPDSADGRRFGSWDDEVGDIGELFDLAVRRPAWHRLAACRGVGGVDWFADEPEAVEAARAVCERCPVLVECRAWALEQGRDLHGVFGGMSRSQRSTFHRDHPRRRRRPAA